MAIATLNPILTGINGRIGSIVFYKRRDRQCIRTYVKPHNPDTTAQKIIRRTFAEAVKSWQSISRDEKYKYNRKARCTQMSGYNLYISGYMKNQISDLHNPELQLYPYSNPLIFHSVSYSDNTQFPKINPFTRLKFRYG